MTPNRAGRCEELEGRFREEFISLVENEQFWFELIYDLKGADAEAESRMLGVIQDAAIGNHEVAEKKEIEDRKISSLSYYHLSRNFLLAERLEDAKRYYQLGDKIRLRTPRERERYDALYSELFEERFTGKLLTVISDKGYGFIEREDAPGQTVFVHITQFVTKLTNEDFESMQGTRVSFNIQETEKGPQANNVRVILS